MAQVEFIFNGYKTVIQCTMNETFSSICNKFVSKIQANINNLNFLYGGYEINEFGPEITFNQIANILDKERKIMTLLVFERVSTIVNNNIKISKQIICPQCLENTRMKIENYKIKFYECKNGHVINNRLLKEYESMQKIDELKIMCNLCQNNKANSFNKEFYRCNSCKINLCPLCKSTHNKSHNCINYEEKNYKCEKHKNELYNSYCKKCKQNICTMCESEHINHEIISYGKILAKKEDKIEESNDLKQLINNYKINIKDFKDKIDNILNNINENFDIKTI